MPTKPRIVQCPKCRALLQEPPPGNPFYQCGRCSTTLQAKHATAKDLEAMNGRISADQQSRYSYSDSSSGEIVSEVLADEFTLSGNGNESPLHRKKQSATESAPENGSFLRGVTKPQRVYTQDGVVDPYLQSVRNHELSMKQRVIDVVPGAEHIPGRATQQEIGSSGHRPSSPDVSFGITKVQPQQTELRSRTDVTCAGEFKTLSSVGQSYGTETLQCDNFMSGGVQQLQESHVQCAHPNFALESVQDSGYNHGHANLRGVPSHEYIVNNVMQPPMAAGNIASGASRARLRWQVREFDSGDEATSSGAASSKGISEDDDGSSQDDRKSSASVKETTSVEYVVDHSRTVHSLRRSITEDRRPLDEQVASGQELQRTPSEGSDRIVDMYENSAHLLDYEPSDSSSTTMEEVEINGAAGPGRFSGEIERYAPVFDQGSSRISYRPNLPRSATISSTSGRSSESGSYSPQIGMLSPDNHLDHARNIDNSRRHSWDERVSRMGSAAPGYMGPHQGPSSVRQMSGSQDYGSGQAEHLQRMSSDPGGRIYNIKGRQLPTSVYDNYRQPSPFALSPLQPEQQGANRYLPSSQSIQQQWSPNSAHRPYFPEPSPLHPLHSRLSSSLRQIPGQLPPKQGLYPLLPPPGTLPHVQCQHCTLLLAVPDNLPPSQKTTQKLRCGSCRKISIFSVPQAEGSSAMLVSSPSRSNSLNSPSLLPSSPDNQAEFASAYKAVSDSLSAGERQRSARRYSVSDLAQQKKLQARLEVQAGLVRKRSLGNEDVAAIDEEMVERALSERVETLAIDSNFASTQYSASSTPESANSPIYSDVRLPNVMSPEPLPVFSNNDLSHRKTGSPYSRFSNIPQNENGGGNVPAGERRSSEVILSDSDSDSILRSQSATSSPKLNQSNSGSPLPISSPVQDPKSTGRAPDDASNEVGSEDRVLNKALNRIFMFRKSRHVGASHYRRKVVVNGIPIPDHLVKKAEEQAGPIHPGTYWYDVQAGFWGVAGGQCLGIIPPFIEELNYPMTRDCAAGRTGIFVNGRELHHMDRDKLCRRGLPETPGMSYRIEIDGRVIEEATGSEHRGLGRLAPSLEKSGRGTGMHVPSNISGGRS